MVRKDRVVNEAKRATLENRVFQGIRENKVKLGPKEIREILERLLMCKIAAAVSLMMSIIPVFM